MNLGRNVAQKVSGSLIEVIPTARALGAEVRDVDLRSFDDWAFAGFMRALLKHQVLLVRGQTLSDHERTALSRRFGNAAVVYTPFGATLGKAATFYSLYAAYDALPPRLRSRIAHLKARQLLTADEGPPLWPVGSIQSATSGTVQPLVNIHPDTGRSLLALGSRRHAYLVGLELAESDALLDELWDFAVRPEFAWSHVGRQGDLLVWDARCTIHRADVAIPPPQRLLHSAEIWSSIGPA
ncbi:TauD/TfdA family dioxygenase [Bradyrhizobium sp. SZCCHNS2096]|uniref:TauD/TfdA dioxygenase family protein n=1 Tax=Bradyrhizobium sp. SZCCHNS2096 TaxID=3057309 RepID=UPI002916980F|nr:TauD/TfdA family dioxygenase [Bradyrhizobium sp. SZCCHNS2096]